MQTTFVKTHPRRRGVPSRPVSRPVRTDREKIARLISEVETGKRSGYTYTKHFKFDVYDPRTMDQVYARLGDRTMYVVAKTNRPVRDFTLEGSVVGTSQGVGLWRDAGVTYVDDIVLFFGPKVSEDWARTYARLHGQRYILKVHGLSRSFEFLEVR